MHSLLVFLQTALPDQCPVVAGLLLQLDLLVWISHLSLSLSLSLSVTVSVSVSVSVAKSVEMTVTVKNHHLSQKLKLIQNDNFNHLINALIWG
jgi:hypothetical protein